MSCLAMTYLYIEVEFNYIPGNMIYTYIYIYRHNNLDILPIHHTIVPNLMICIQSSWFLTLRSLFVGKSHSVEELCPREVPPLLEAVSEVPPLYDLDYVSSPKTMYFSEASPVGETVLQARLQCRNFTCVLWG